MPQSVRNRFLRTFGILFAICGLVVTFQNCGKSVLEASAQDDSSFFTPDPVIFNALDLGAPQSAGTGPVEPFQSETDDLNLWRRRIWAAKCGPAGDKIWEVCFEGANVPGDGSNAHLFWDNPIDDDWNSSLVRSTSWIWNSVSTVSGLPIMHVDRTITGVTTATGHFWRRDEFLTRESGLLAQFKIRKDAESLARGVVLHFYDDRDAFTLSFDPNSISFVPAISATSAPTATLTRINTSWTTFVVRKVAGTSRVFLYANGVRLFATTNLESGSSSNI